MPGNIITGDSRLHCNVPRYPRDVNRTLYTLFGDFAEKYIRNFPFLFGAFLFYGVLHSHVHSTLLA